MHQDQDQVSGVWISPESERQGRIILNSTLVRLCTLCIDFSIDQFSSDLGIDYLTSKFLSSNIYSSQCIILSQKNDEKCRK